MSAYRYSVSLRFRHPSMDPREITLALGFQPQTSWRAGDPRVTPVGRQLGGTRTETYWCSAPLAEGYSPPDGLPTALHATLDKLESSKPLFERIRADGGRVEFFVGRYIKSSGGDEFDQSLLRRLVDLQIDLGLDNYHDPNDANLDEEL